MSSSLLLFPQRFSWYILWPSSDVCWTLEPSRNFELHPLLKPRRVACSDSISHNRVQVLSIPVLLLACSEDWTCHLLMKLRQLKEFYYCYCCNLLKLFSTTQMKVFILTPHIHVAKTDQNSIGSIPLVLGSTHRINKVIKIFSNQLESELCDSQHSELSLLCPI